MAADIDWDAIEADYIAGMSHTQLSQKYGVPKGTIATKSSKGKWKRTQKAVDQKAHALLVGKVARVVAGDRADKMAEIITANDTMGRVLKRITQQLEELEKAPVKNLRDMSDLAKAIAMTTDTMLKLYGIPTQSQEHAQKLAELRLEMDRQKLELDKARAESAQDEGEDIEIRIITPEEEAAADAEAQDAEEA